MLHRNHEAAKRARLGHVTKGEACNVLVLCPARLADLTEHREFKQPPADGNGAPN